MSPTTETTTLHRREDGTIYFPEQPGVIYTPVGVDPPKAIGEEKPWLRSKTTFLNALTFSAGALEFWGGWLSEYNLPVGALLMGQSAIAQLIRFLTCQPVTLPGRPVITAGEAKGQAR